eukprot:11218682-Lingulodinium_polyedra.AAC.1
MVLLCARALGQKARALRMRAPCLRVHLWRLPLLLRMLWFHWFGPSLSARVIHDKPWVVEGSLYSGTPARAASGLKVAPEAPSESRPSSAPPGCQNFEWPARAACGPKS